jgi:hypothetical protein
MLSIPQTLLKIPKKKCSILWSKEKNFKKNTKNVAGRRKEEKLLKQNGGEINRIGETGTVERRRKLKRFCVIQLQQNW